MASRPEATISPNLVAGLGQLGIEVIETTPTVRVGARSARRSIYIRDPYGYTIELKEA